MSRITYLPSSKGVLVKDIYIIESFLWQSDSYWLSRKEAEACAQEYEADPEFAGQKFHVVTFKPARTLKKKITNGGGASVTE